ncbi:15986_t:CDS:2 [Dentiscutata erythropus]|uniref:15986_t:CDS:1 n=1 Tax=Dentiscutata erythropus TaxID=1348616 RepID=A0A9N9GMJ4_9GLOM|nr:15986_t:CDS:2 [Dentiscutata erythropus]
MPSLKKLVTKIIKKSNVATRSIPPQEQIYENMWSDFDQGEEWNVEEPFGSTGIKEDFESSSIQAEQEDPLLILVAAVESFGGRCGEIGNDLDNTIQDLLDGKVRIEDFSLINVCLIENVFYSSDNRRLYCFKEAIKRGLNVDRIPEVVVSSSLRNGRVIDEERQKEREEQEKREAREREEREKQRQYEQEERKKEREEREKREANE